MIPSERLDALMWGVAARFGFAEAELWGMTARRLEFWHRGHERMTKEQMGG